MVSHPVMTTFSELLNSVLLNSGLLDTGLLDSCCAAYFFFGARYTVPKSLPSWLIMSLTVLAWSP